MIMGKGKVRLDVLVAECGLAESREQAQRLVLAGQVTVDGAVAVKPGHKFDSGALIHVKERQRFVGRGGEKMEAAFEAFGLNVEGMVCIDIGSSTGGFTDCLLQHGALQVFAVDVGKGQLHWKLRNDPRVTVMEKINARYLKKGDFAAEPGFAAVDVSFISLTKVLPAVIQVLVPGAEMVTLIKPQFEARREQVEKGGVIRDPAVRIEVADRIRRFGTDELGLQWLESLESPLKGPAGNVELLVHWRKSA
jgi:23S rRNA (cytidine1920-2'-O)/16S rRNA (cytidine1409-2'-O)-methyltransferase